MTGSTIKSGGLLQSLHSFQANRIELSRSLIRLSTGQRINRGADDPAGLISSNRLSAALAVLEAENQSLQRTNHVANTAEGALDEVSSLLSDSRGLEVQLANSGALSSDEQAAIQQQIDANTQAIDRITANAGFNGQSLFNGSVSLNAGGETLDLPSLSSHELGATDLNGQTYHLSDTASGGALTGDAAGSSQVLENAIIEVASLRGQIGAFQMNTVGSTLTANQIAYENLAEARSMIADTDFASEIVTLNRLSILDKASLKALSIISRTSDHMLDLLS